jgi:hypothetical protein
VSKATITFDLSIPEDAFDYKCSMKGLDACLLLESLKETVRRYNKHGLPSEAVLHDLIVQLNEWSNVE